MKRVLLVEDKAENLYYLRTLFEGRGWLTECAANGAEALDKASRRVPDLVISDLLMPVMDGYTLLRKWKSDPQLAHVPFVVYTATYTEPEDEQLALKCGANAFILKPCEPVEFLALIDAVLARNGSAPSPPRPAPPDEPTLLKDYNEALIRKLEQKSLQLEESNRALRRESAELRTRDRAIQAVSQGIIITSNSEPGDPIIYASPGFERLTGYSAEEVIGRNCRLLQGPDTDPVALAELGRAMAEGRGVTVELLNYRKDGTTFWNHLTISVVSDDAGVTTHFVGVQTDVTERRQLEAQLRQAQKMEAVGLLAGGVAHDFNNLLSVILGYSAFVLDGLSTSDPLRADVEEIRRAGERATVLTRQLLAFSRQQILEPQVLDLGQVVRGMENLLRRLLGENIQLSLVSRLAGKVLADLGQVEQVLMNLAVNARDAMQGSGKLRIEIADVELEASDLTPHHECAPGPYVMLAVSDTGSGIEPRTRERIFEPFFTTKEKGKGTGLGLSTVFGIVKQSHGHISVSSELGCGTTFKVYLPRTAQAANPSLAAPATERSLSGTETVLFVEDDEQVRVMAAATLRRNGFNVLEAQNGGEALLICEQYAGKIQLLATEVAMPRMSGKHLAERLSAVHPELKVLYISGDAEGSVVSPGVLGTGPLFLAKPLTPSALLSKVREALDREY